MRIELVVSAVIVGVIIALSYRITIATEEIASILRDQCEIEKIESLKPSRGIVPAVF